MKMNSKSSSIRTARIILLAVIFLLAVSWTYLTSVGLAEQSQHSSWVETEASHTITPEEASALIGVPADDITVLWSRDYSTGQYPVIVTLHLAGLDGLPVYVFEYVDDKWALLGTQTAPVVEVQVNQDGSLSAVTAPAGSKIPGEHGNTQRNRYLWLIATAIVTAAGIAFALVSTRKKGL